MAIASVNSLSAPLLWTEEQDNLLAGLNVLAHIKPNNKIQIQDPENYQICIDDRYLQCFRRGISGDGCKASIDIISKIMEGCLSYSALVHSTGTKIDKKVQNNYAEMEKLYGPAIVGISNLCKLYAGPTENELSSAKVLTQKINIYGVNILVYTNEVEIQEVCQPSIPLEGKGNSNPSMTRTVIANVAIPALSAACFAVSTVGTVSTAAKIIIDLMTIEKYATIPLMVMGIKTINMARSFPFNLIV